MIELIYENNGIAVTINKNLANKINTLLSHGLCLGLGSPEPGKMCVEAAVNYACGFDHGDDPVCVGKAMRAFKIILNDSPWSSNKARANGMRKIAIAQLGSDKIDQVVFAEKIVLKNINIVLAKLFSDLGFEKEAKACAKAKTLKEAIDAAAKSAEYDAEAAAEYAETADKYLIMSADICFDVLKEMKSQGCEFVG